MQPAVIQQLLDLNNTFYQTFGKAFAVTRRRIQLGITRCLVEFPATGDWLDLGCGGGTVADAWAKTPARQGHYLGVDFSPVLLEEARQTVQCLADERIRIDFCQADLASLAWKDCLAPDNPFGAPAQFDVISAFAVFHHIPDSLVRQKIFNAIYDHLKPGGIFVLSVWQMQNSPKLIARLQPWERAGLSPELLEEGDVLMDWRFSLPGQPEQTGLRYVHLFTREELTDLAAQAGFEIVDSFESDGENSRLGLYQIWKKPLSFAD